MIRAGTSESGQEAVFREHRTGLQVLLSDENLLKIRIGKDVIIEGLSSHFVSE